MSVWKVQILYKTRLQLTTGWSWWQQASNCFRVFVLICCDFITLLTLRPCFCVAISITYSIRSSAPFPRSGCFGHQVYFWWLFKLMKHITLDQHSVSDLSLNIAYFSWLGEPGVNTTHSSSEMQYRLPLQQLTQCICYTKNKYVGQTRKLLAAMSGSLQTN